MPNFNMSTLRTMKQLINTILCLTISTIVIGQDLYFPPSEGNEWENMAPSELGWCTEKIDSLYQFLEEEETRSFIVLKDGRIVLEQYFGTYTADSLWTWFSAGKSLRAMLIGIAQEEGVLDIYNQTSDYLGTGWSSLTPEQEGRITVKHQLEMTTGLDENQFDCITPECLTYVAPAGTRWAYHNGPYNLLKQVLQNATGINHNLYTFSRIAQPIGMTTGIWVPVGNNDFYVSNARDMARYGLLIQNEGTWDQEVILGDSEYFEDMVTPSQLLNPAYGYLWWLNGQDSYLLPGFTESVSGPIAPDAPDDMFTAAGGLGQYISVSPSNGLVIVRQGLFSEDDLAPVTLLNSIWKRVLDLGCENVSVHETEMNQLKAYPNPASNMLYLSEPVDVELYDLTGKQKLQKTLTSEIDISQLPQGIYLLQLKIGSAISLLKIVKN